MRKAILTFIIWGIFFMIHAQVASYTFSYSPGTSIFMGDGVLLESGFQLDNQSYNALPIGFTFFYNGASFTQFSANINGFMALGSEVSSSYTAISSGTTNNIIAAMNGDLKAGDGNAEIRYKLQGSAPNRVLTVDWHAFVAYTLPAGDNLNFQIRLYETTNIIEVFYGGIGVNSLSRTVQVGLRGCTNVDFNNRTTTTNWSATTAGTVNTATCTMTSTINPENNTIFRWTPPTCLAPFNITVTAITPTSAKIEWVKPVQVTPAFYQWKIVLAGAGSGATAIATDTANHPKDSAAAIGLNPGTLYDVYVRTSCDSTNYGGWSAVVTFQTPCVPIFSFPYSQPFSTYLPVCWDEGQGGNSTTGPTTISNNASTRWVGDGFLNAGSTGAARIVINTYSANDWLISPDISIPASPAYLLSYNTGATYQGNTIPPSPPWEDDDTLKLLITTSYPANWQVLRIYNSANVPSYLGQTEKYLLSAYAGQTVRFAYWLKEGNQDGVTGIDFFVDNFTIVTAPSCNEPTGLSASGISTTSANLSWVAPPIGSLVNYEWKIVLSGTGPGGTAIASGTVNHPAVIASTNGLTPGTAYNLFVRTYCGGSNYSDWSWPLTFNTQCNAVDVPWSETFDGFSAPGIPVCFKITNDNSDSFIWYTNTNVRRSIPNSIAIGTNSSFATDDWFFTAGINLQGGISYTLEFWYTGGDLSYPEKLEVRYGSSQNEAGMLATPLFNNTNITCSTVFQQASVNFTPVASGAYYFGFHGYSAASMQFITVDDISVFKTITCFTPVNLSTPTVQSFSALFDWDPAPAGAETNWQICWGESGFTPGNTNETERVLVNTTHQYLINSLQCNHSYTAYVRAVCGVNDTSAWSAANNFTTANPYITLPFTETFEPGSPTTNLWTMLDADIGNELWVLSTIYNHTTGGTQSTFHDFSIFGMQDGYLFSPYIITTSCSGSGLKLSFWSYNEFASTYYKNSVLISDDLGTTFTEIWTPNIVSESWVKDSVDISAYTNDTVIIAFRYEGDFAHTWFVDDVNVNCETLYTGTKESITNGIEFYPNPTNGIFVIDFGNLAGNTDIFITDLYGRIVIADIRKLKTSDKIQYDLSGFANGIYNIQIINNDLMENIKIVKQ